MSNINDEFIQELIDATRSHKLMWSFTHPFDDFTAEYNGMGLMFEHTVEKSMCYDRLALGISKEKTCDVYASNVRVELDGTITSNPAYDLLSTLRQAAINQKNEIILKLECGLLLDTGLLDVLIEDTSEHSNVLTWTFDGKQYTGEIEEYSATVIVHETSDGPEKITVTVCDRHHGKDILHCYKGDRNWHMANKLRNRIRGSIIAFNPNFLATLPEATLNGIYKWNKMKSGNSIKTFRCVTDLFVMCVFIREGNDIFSTRVEFDLNVYRIQSSYKYRCNNFIEEEIYVKRLISAIFKSGYSLDEINITEIGRHMRYQ